MRFNRDFDDLFTVLSFGLVGLNLRINYFEALQLKIHCLLNRGLWIIFSVDIAISTFEGLQVGNSEYIGAVLRATLKVILARFNRAHGYSGILASSNEVWKAEIIVHQLYIDLGRRIDINEYIAVLMIVIHRLLFPKWINHDDIGSRRHFLALLLIEQCLGEAIIAVVWLDQFSLISHQGNVDFGWFEELLRIF